jgi:hypothetical protein
MTKESETLPAVFGHHLPATQPPVDEELIRAQGKGLPPTPAEDFEPSFSTEQAADEKVIDDLSMLGAQGAWPVVSQIMALKTVRGRAPTVEH